jgi:hypothetical protein
MHRICRVTLTLLWGKEGKEDGKVGKEEQEQEEPGEEERAQTTLERQARVETKVVSRGMEVRRVGRVRGRSRTRRSSRVTVLIAPCGGIHRGIAPRGRRIGMEGKVEPMPWRERRRYHM